MGVIDTSSDAMTAVANAVTNGRCILFLGAGVHYPPPTDAAYEYPEGERPPLGRDLARRLAKASGFEHSFPHESATNLQRVALYFQIRHSRYELVKMLERELRDGRRPSPIVRGLARLPFPLVATTNYDNLFERAIASTTEKDPFVSIYDPTPFERARDAHDPTPERPLIFKMHGDFQSPESIVVTDEDYIQFVLRMSQPRDHGPIPETFLFHFARWPTLFVGYSLLDFDLRLLFKTLRWGIDDPREPSYSVDRTPDPLIVAVWHEERRLVHFINQDVWTFVPELFRRVTGTEMPQ